MNLNQLRARLAGCAVALAGAITLLPSAGLAQESTPAATPVLQPVSEICANGGMGMNMDMSQSEGTPVVPADAEFDLAFIDLMIVHHEGAITMATVALERAEHQEIKDLANDIISAQASEITQMKAWRDEWYPGAAQLTEAQAMAIFDQAAADNPGMAGVPGSSEMMMGDHAMMPLCEAEAGMFDLAFIDGMIPHHAGAILMAQAALQFSTHQAIKDMANDIISAQQSEIDGMTAWRTLWYPDAPAADDGHDMGGMDMATPSH